MLLREWGKKLRETLIDDEKNKRALGIATYSILLIVAVIMTVMNIFTHKGALTVATGVFAVLSAINLGLSLMGNRGVQTAQFVFSAEIICLFIFFLVSGNPEGFSAIWICMLPEVGMLFFGTKRGTILCGIMELVLIFFLWTPIGNSCLQYAYTSSFLMRFPVLFFAFTVIAVFLDLIRVLTMKELNRLQKLYHDMSVKDTLTGVFNRQGMYSELETNKQYQTAGKLGVIMFDIDHFKEVNDTYGHNAGDLILKDFSRLVTQHLNALVCRWGGEEFVAIFTGDAVKQTDLEFLKDAVEQHVFDFEDQQIRITVSTGVYETAEFDIDRIDRMVELADHALYEAKETGRNRIVYYDQMQHAEPEN